MNDRPSRVADLALAISQGGWRLTDRFGGDEDGVWCYASDVAPRVIMHKALPLHSARSAVSYSFACDESETFASLEGVAQALLAEQERE